MTRETINGNTLTRGGGAHGMSGHPAHGACASSRLQHQGKGKKDRLIPIGERALAWIAKYLDDVRPLFMVEPDYHHLFLGAWGEPLTVAWVTDRVRDYVQRADLGKSGSCHLFRHTMATLMLKGGADIRHVQEMLGHADIKTTQVYTQVSIQKLKAVYDATHPGAKLERKEHADGE
jgi:integrase/recombinase XerD